MLAAGQTGHNADRAAALEERLGDVRPLLITRRLAQAGTLLGAVLILGGWLPVNAGLAAVLLAAFVVIELERYLVRTARSTGALERRLAFVALLYTHLNLAVLHLSADALWIGLVAFAVSLVSAGTILPLRWLLPLTAYSALLFVAYISLAIGGIVAPQSLVPGGDMASTLRPFEAGVGHLSVTLSSIAAVALVFPTLALLTYGMTRRLRRTRDVLTATTVELRDAQRVADESRERLRVWNDQLHREIDRKTAVLEGQNRYLAAINAISFAVSSPMDDEGAAERNARLIARVLGMQAVQVHVPAADGQPAVDLLVPASPDAGPVAALPLDALKAVIAEGSPRFPGDESGGAGAAIVPIAAKGHTLGAFAAIAQPEHAWIEQERHLLMLVGRELGIAFENGRLYRAALAATAVETALNEALRTIAGEPDVERGVGRALDVSLRDLDGLVAGVVVRSEGGQRSEVLARAVRSGATFEPSALSSVLVLAASLSRDRSRPLVLGPTGEAPVSSRSAAEGIETLVLAPIVAARASIVSPADAGAVRGAGSRQAVVGALVVAAGPGVRWGPGEIEFFARLANGIARRLESDDLVRLQARRIRELGGLARVATTVQSTVDSERLYGGFAQAMYELAEYRRLYVARLDDAGGLTAIVRYTERGRPMPAATLDAGDSLHGWFTLRAPTAWRRGDEAPPSFALPDDEFGIVIPLRPRGQVLGVAFVATASLPSPDLVAIVGQAVEQLALALDSAALYRQATDRAARIQVLGHLARIVASVVDLREAFGAFADEVRWLIPFDRAVMMLIDEPAGDVESYATYPEDGDNEVIRGPLVGSFAEVALRSGGPVSFSRADARAAGYDWSAFGHDVQEIAAVPVVNNGVGTAMFALARTSGQEFAAEEFSHLEEVAGLLAVTIDRLRLYEEAEYNARHDSLTGLPNLRLLNERLEELEPQLREGVRAAIMMIDMDDLKMFNDTLGHSAGDQVIQIVGRELTRSCRATDLVARVGGDEFVVLMTDVEAEAAARIAERVHQVLWNVQEEIPGAPTRVRISIGIAGSPADGQDARSLLAAADQAMYEAKFAGGRRTMLASERRGPLPAPRIGRRPHRVVETFVHATVAAASPIERERILAAERYLMSAALHAGIAPDSTLPLRMLVSAVASGRLELPHQVLDPVAGSMLITGLREEWRERAPDHAAIGMQLCELAVELSWLQAPAPAGEDLEIGAALEVLRTRHSAAADVVALLEQALRDEGLAGGERAA